jgi:N-acetylglucosaminyl-diphospho-decaprenol L-rhamnosyltransferase
MTPHVSVAVVSWNTRELLADCLESLRPDMRAGRASVWVVDNGSVDGSAEMVRRRFAWAQLVALDENIGFGAAVNLIADRADTAWIAAANADIALRPGALEALIRSGEGKVRAGAIAPRLVMPSGQTQHSVHPFPSLRLGLVFNLGLVRLVPRLGDRLGLEGYWDPNPSRRVDWAHGAFLLVRRQAFLQVGGFDPAQWMYAEDLDLCWRLRQAGWLTFYEPAAVVEHEVGAATRQAFAEERDRRHISAAYVWMAKRQGRVAASAYAAVNWLGSVVRWLALTPLARARPERYAASRASLRRYAGLHWRGLGARALTRSGRGAT